MIDSGGAASPSVASTMMMFMVRGLLYKLDYQFAGRKGMTGVSIFGPIWEAVARLERIGFLCWLYAVSELPQSFRNYTVKIISCSIKHPKFMLQRATGFCISFQTLHIF